MKHPYSTFAYANALAHWGRPLHVPEWDTWVLIREIQPGFEDASGTYPITILDKDADIAGGLERLRHHQLVSVVLVLDDFHRPPLDELRRYFTVVKNFKTHYVHRQEQADVIYSRHHSYELRQALKTVRVGPLDLRSNIEHWYKLYSNLISHRGLTGLHAFPLEHHIAIGKLAGVTTIGAWQENELVSCHIWFTDGVHVHSHLAASSMQGYACRAAYAVNDASLSHFRSAKVINFGGGMGYIDNANDGLAKFKQGFSNSTASSYICGAVLDDRRYADLLSQRDSIEQPSFFPVYRTPSHTVNKRNSL